MIDEKMRIGGKKVDGENGTIDVFNPFNGEKVGSVPRASKGQVDQTMEIAKNFQPK
ncbi:MAG TPA: aldehyde dehydrogenase, partial [Deltaproteobacteria bacterium]|nr:aldehyde dehydrogenase [Deltaproteobacteria bacterium]